MATDTSAVPGHPPADPRFVTADGWQEARRTGIRTIIDLRNHHEVDRGLPAPPGIDRLHVPLDDFGDTEFWGGEIIAAGSTARRCTSGPSSNARPSGARP